MSTASEKDNLIKGFDTRAIHGGQHVDPATHALITPIYANATYAQESPGVHTGFEYGRSQNPTRFAFERAVAALEGGQAGFAFSSGLAASATVLELLDAGAHVIAIDDLYGGTYRLLERVRRRSAGLEVSYVDLTDASRLKEAIRPTTRMVWLETPTNPLLKLADIAAIAEEAHRHDLIVVVDNTFASPFIQRPLELGADITLHSATKYISGHSDVIGGVAVASRPDLVDKLRFLQNAAGAISGPFDSFLMHRGVKTLGLRMERHSSNALHLAAWLEAHPKVERVIYPGLESHPQYALAQSQMGGKGGGMVTAFLKGGRPAVDAALSRTHLFTLAESLGGVESLIEYPAVMTHASIPAEMRAKSGITDSLIRLSVGIEDVADLQADLAQALG
ncbi:MULTISPECIES: PLP-dependent aspartate aminotransferase family protein [Rhodomicrobium]|uniref:trans-sulfuration enzyme family protein n=1 Tax=Rhodomicrobium TaxID=1068 RepID=UPI000B4BDA7E|nr:MULTISPECIES: PLP-dependent aspartate aminotransferase family protein [Rhodomicrobium]